MIKRIELEDINDCFDVIRSSFKTVADEFHLTKENCPTHTSFISKEKLMDQFHAGRPMYGYFAGNKLAGYFSLDKNSDSTLELNNLAVLPEYRHKGIGEELLQYARSEARKMNADKITIGIMEENTILKDWYTKFGFIHKGTRKFEHLPFTVGFMEIPTSQ